MLYYPVLTNHYYIIMGLKTTEKLNQSIILFLKLYKFFF